MKKKNILLLGYMAALGFLSLNPWITPSSEPVSKGLWFELPFDKLDHAVAYAGLATLFLWVGGKYCTGFKLWLLGFLLPALIGILMEYCQGWFTEIRMFSYGDALANSVGALLGLVLFAMAKFMVRRFSGHRWANRLEALLSW